MEQVDEGKELKLKAWLQQESGSKSRDSLSLVPPTIITRRFSASRRLLFEPIKNYLKIPSALVPRPKIINNNIGRDLLAYNIIGIRGMTMGV
jgi:hypothetical protein